MGHVSFWCPASEAVALSFVDYYSDFVVCFPTYPCFFTLFLTYLFLWEKPASVSRLEVVRGDQTWVILVVLVSFMYSIFVFLMHDYLCSVSIGILYIFVVISFGFWLWSPYVIGQTIIFSSCFFLSFFLLSSFFSSPNLSGRRLDVYHTSAHGVALVQI